MILNSGSFNQLIKEFPELNSYLTELISQRFVSYTNFFLTRIKDSPEKRYQNLADYEPELLERAPQHYLASYLGITPVSLSRIRNRVKLT